MANRKGKKYEKEEHCYNINSFIMIITGIGSAFAFGLFYNPLEIEPKEEKDLLDKEPPTMMSVEEGLSVAELHKTFDDEKIEYTSVQKTKDDEYLSYDSEVAAYKIQASSGSLAGFYRKDLIPNGEVLVSMEEAEKIAIAAVKKYRNDFDLSTMTQTVAFLHESRHVSRYEFEWRLFKQGVDIGHTINVEVTGSGEFSAFVCNNNIDFEPDTSKVNLSVEEIKEMALSYIKSGQSGQKADNLTVEEARMISRGNELFWRVELKKYENDLDNPEIPPDEYYYLMIINAETGEIVEKMAG